MKEAGTRCLLEIKFPEKLWLGHISKLFPYHQIDIRSFIPISQDPFIGNSLITISGKEIDDILKRLDSYNTLLRYDIMDKSPIHLSLKAETKDQLLLRSIVKNSILVEFPIQIIKGNAKMRVMATRENVDHFVEDLAGHGIHTEITSIGQYSESPVSQILTDRQYFIYQKAKESGYYDSPRKITLTELASSLEMAKSSLSSMLQRIHKNLLGN
jgi:predicted DNA binding protein